MASEQRYHARAGGLLMGVKGATGSPRERRVRTRCVRRVRYVPVRAGARCAYPGAGASPCDAVAPNAASISLRNLTASSFAS